MDGGCWEGIGFNLMILLRLASCRYADCRRTSISIIISKSTNTIYRGLLMLGPWYGPWYGPVVSGCTHAG